VSRDVIATIAKFSPLPFANIFVVYSAAARPQFNAMYEHAAILKKGPGGGGERGGAGRLPADLHGEQAGRQ